MKKILLLLIILLLPFNVFAQDELIPNSASGILIEADSGKIIFEKDKDKRVSIASMTKMVAQIIILEEIEKGHIKWNDIVTVSRNASDMGGSQIYLEEGEKISIEDLMKGISVASGNDATVAMAEVISGTEEKFVKKMNAKVKKLGLKNTHFTNCTGLDTDDHYSSSYDMAMIARDLVVNHPEILRFSSIYEDYLREDTDKKFWLVNTNKLINFYDGADGLKTGHTDAAGYCLAATAKRNDLRLIAIVLGEKESKVRNAETISLLDYGFNNVKLKKVVSKGTIVKKIKVNKATKDVINVKLKNNLNVVENAGINNNNYKFNIKMNNIDLPLKKDTVVGNIEVIYKNKVISIGELIVDEKIDKLNYLELLRENIFDVVFGTI